MHIVHSDGTEGDVTPRHGVRHRTGPRRVVVGDEPAIAFVSTA
jgi:hypothetical protein